MLTKEQYDKSFYKVIDTINSCTHPIHFVKVHNMIWNFYYLFEKDFSKQVINDRVLLRDLSEKKSYQLRHGFNEEGNEQLKIIADRTKSFWQRTFKT